MGDSANLDDAAAQLQATADEVLKETGSDEAAAKAGGKTEAMRKMSKIVKGTAEKGFTDSKDFLSKVVTSISTHASEVGTTASSKYQDAKSRGLSSADAAKEVAAAHYTTAKDAASLHVANMHANINKAIAQGQSHGSQETSTVSTTTDRDMSSSDSESLSWPYSWIAWVVSCCSGKGSSSPASSSSAETTDKGFSDESLQNAAAALTESLHDGTKSKASGSEGSKPES